MALLSANSRLLNSFILSQRRGVLKRAIGLCSDTYRPTYYLLSAFSTKNCTVKISNCACLTRSYGLITRQIIYSSSVNIRNHGSTSECEKPEPKPSLYQRFKSMYRDYWYVLLPVHMVTSATWFASFYYMSSSGVDIAALLDTLNVVALLEKLNVSDKILNPLRNGEASSGYHLAIALALYKIVTPLRYTVTLGGTTVAINYMKKWGYIKPVPSREKLKEMYEGKKEIFKEKGQNLKDNMMKSLKQTAND